MSKEALFVASSLTVATSVAAALVLTGGGTPCDSGSDCAPAPPIVREEPLPIAAPALGITVDAPDEDPPVFDRAVDLELAGDELVAVGALSVPSATPASPPATVPVTTVPPTTVPPTTVPPTTVPPTTVPPTTVPPVDAPPVAMADAFTVSEDAVGEWDLFADNGHGRDADPEGSTLRVVSIEGRADNVGRAVETSTGASLTVTADGRLRYDPRVVHDGLDSGDTLVDTFAYTIADAAGHHAGATVSIVVAGSGDAPFAVADVGYTVQGGSVAVDVLANDSDPEGDAFELVAVSQDGILGAVSLVDGAIRYEAPVAYDALGEGEHATESFRYQVADASGLVSWGEVTIDVAGANDAPTAADDVIKTACDESVEIVVLVNDDDVDATDALTVSIIVAPSAGDVVVKPDGTVVYTPAAGYTGRDSFSYRIADSSGAIASASVTVSVVGSHDADND